MGAEDHEANVEQHHDCKVEISYNLSEGNTRLAPP